MCYINVLDIEIVYDLKYAILVLVICKAKQFIFVRIILNNIANT